jgi:hypothetical protein
MGRLGEKMRTKQKTYWWVDIVLFFGFVVAFFLSFTGVELHQWIGIFGGLLAAYHLLIHWDWVDAVAKRLSASTGAVIWLKFITDGVIMSGFVAIILTGLVISTWLNLPVSDVTGWLSLHIITSITTLLALLVKLVLHWRWISRTTKDVVQSKTILPAASHQLVPVPVQRQSMDRRDFLKVMGMLGGASLLAFLSATWSLASLQDESSTVASLSESGASSSSDPDSSRYMSSSPFASSSSSCFIQCNRRCSYPGHCRRYTDTDNDNYCDLGQCA